MISVFTLKESGKWDSIVKSFDNYDVYWLSGYVKAFKINGDGEPLLFYYSDDCVRGINVVMKRDISEDDRFNSLISKDKYYDFSTPYGYGGWIVEGNNHDILFNEYFKWCKENSIVCEFVRFHPVVDNSRFSRDYYDVVDLGHTVSLDLPSPEVIWENITSKNRNMIRKAQKSGVEIKSDNTDEIYKVFREIYDQTMKKDDAEDYYFFKEDFYNSIRNDFADNAKVFYACYDGKIIAASIMLYAGDKLNYHLSGSRFEYRHLAPSNLLLYEAALWGFENGCKTFHLGGGVGSGEDNLFRFKKSFYRKDDLCQFSIGRIVFDSNKYEYLVSLRNKIENENYFPRYRG